MVRTHPLVAFTYSVHSLLQQSQRSCRIHSQVFGGRLTIIRQVRRPVPNHKQVQELQTNRNTAETLVREPHAEPERRTEEGNITINIRGVYQHQQRRWCSWRFGPKWIRPVYSLRIRGVTSEGKTCVKGVRCHTFNQIMQTHNNYQRGCTRYTDTNQESAKILVYRKSTESDYLTECKLRLKLVSVNGQKSLSFSSSSQTSRSGHRLREQPISSHLTWARLKQQQARIASNILSRWLLTGQTRCQPDWQENCRT